MPIGNAAWGDFTCDTDAEMTSALNGAVVGTTCLRSDVAPEAGGTLYVCTALPATDVTNWSPWASAGVGGDSGVVEQFGVVDAGLVVTPYRVTTTGAPVGLASPCLVESIMCIAPGSSGTLTIHDAVDATDPTTLRLSIPFGSLQAGGLYKLAGAGAAVVFETSVYITVTGSGVFDLNAVPEAT